MLGRFEDKLVAAIGSKATGFVNGDGEVRRQRPHAGRVVSDWRLMNDEPAIRTRSVSPEFLHTLFGIAVTIFSWYSPWAWPAWPALTALDLIGGQTNWMELEENARDAVLVGLIVLNVGFWAGLSWLFTRAIHFLRRGPSTTR